MTMLIIHHCHIFSHLWVLQHQLVQSRIATGVPRRLLPSREDSRGNGGIPVIRIHACGYLVRQCADVAGGMDNIVLGTLHKYSSGFVGCLSNVTLASDYAVNLIRDAVDGRNIRQCPDARRLRRHLTV